MGQKISTIVISEDKHTQELIKLYLEEFGEFNFLAATDDFSKAYEAVKELSKALIIIDISDYPDPGLNFMAKISQEFENYKILALSDRPNVDLIVKVMRTGVKNFLSLPLIKNDFFTILSDILSEFCGQQKKKTKCRILTVFSNKGGIGKTSIASNLAVELAKITKENVALIDLNFQLGDITTVLDLKPSFNISYMLQNLDKINEDFLLSTLEKYKDTSLYVLADPPYFKQADNISPMQISKLFEILKDTFSYIVVDTSAGFDAKTMKALEFSDLIFLVTTANLPALRSSQRCLELFNKLGFDNSKIQILINRYMENDEIKKEDVEEVLGKKIFWKVPNNYFTMMSAINKGVPVAEINQDSNVARSYKDLALMVSDSVYKQNLIKKFSSPANEVMERIF